MPVLAVGMEVSLECIAPYIVTVVDPHQNDVEILDTLVSPPFALICARCLIVDSSILNETFL